MSIDDAKTIATANLMSKNAGMGVFLSLCFGGIGLMYASIFWGLIGIAIELLALMVVFLSFGLGLILLIPWHIITAIIAMICINGHNKRLLASL